MQEACTSLDKPIYQGVLLAQEPLSQYTTWRVGGAAKQLYKPLNIQDLSQFLKQLPPDEPLLWLGLGSNSLIRDTGFAGTVILTQGCLKEMALLDANTVRVEAGVSCASMARFCARNALAHAEFWAGIPGTMGGALRMNAGCHGGETWDSVIEVQTMDRQGVIHTKKPKDFAIAYRHVEGLQNEWFVSATCRLPSGDKLKALELIKTLLAKRAETQPINEYNCGSVFRNPEGHHAAALIESCGLKGFNLEGAMVSEKHANFIINHQGQAKASAIESLIQLIQKKVHDETRITLMPEVHFIGE